MNDDTVCVVCRDNTRTHALVPCGHKVLCEECVNQLLDKRCPLSNTEYTLEESIHLQLQELPNRALDENRVPEEHDCEANNNIYILFKLLYF